MSFSVEHQTKDGQLLILTILDREEYNQLSIDQKLEYSSSPTNEDEWNTCLLGVQSFIWGIIEDNDSGDFGLPEILDQFMRKNYTLVFESWIEKFKDDGSDIDWNDRTDYFWAYLDDQSESGIVDDDGYDAIDRSDVFILDFAYANDHYYQLIMSYAPSIASKGVKGN